MRVPPPLHPEVRRTLRFPGSLSLGLLVRTTHRPDLAFKSAGINDMDADIGLLTSKEEFLARVTDRLGTYPSDFEPEMRRIKVSGETFTPQLAAGVLIPLLFHESPSRERAKTGEFIFQLIKRSSLVSQPGDLSCPGGMIHPLIDRLLRPLPI